MTPPPLLRPGALGGIQSPSFLDLPYSTRRVASGLSWLWAVPFTLTFIAYYFPPLNWGDEPRNLNLLEDGNYGVFYWRILYFVRDVASGFAPIGPFDVDTSDLSVSNDWRTINGGLRYLTDSGDASTPYYIAKFANIIVALVFVLGFALWNRLRTPQQGTAAASTQTFILCLLTPAVAYQCMQISTDLLFILFSIGLYFVKSRIGQLAYSGLAIALIIEDRSFAILAITGLILAAAPSVISWRRIVDRPLVRAALLFAAAVIGIALGSTLAVGILGGTSSVGSYLSAFRGFEGVQGDIAHSWTRSFNGIDGPVLFYAGLIYMPSRAEFFINTIPLYLLALPIVWRMCKIAIMEQTDRGFRFFFLMIAALLTHSLITYLTHVFESGRYYFTLTPLLVVAFASLFGERGNFVQSPRTVGGIAGAFIAVNVIVTLLVASLT